MSTFTDWNGPQGGSNIRTSDLVALTNAYQSMLSNLNAHIAGTAATDDTHRVKLYVEGLLNSYVRLTELTSTLSAYYTRLDIDNATTGYAKKAELAALNTTVGNKADVAALNAKADVVALDAYIKEAEFDTLATIVSIKSDINGLIDLLKGLNGEVATFTWTGLIQASEAELDEVRTNIMHTEFRDIPAYVGGSDPEGVFYIICQLTEAAGTVYCEFNDDVGMSAAIHYAINSIVAGDAAALSVTCANNGLTGLKFHIVQGSDTTGNIAYYLAVRADDWLATFTSVDGVGYHQTLRYTATGINILLGGDDGYVVPNGACIVLETCSAGNGFSASAFATDEFRATDGNTIFEVIREGKLIHLFIADDNFASVIYRARPYLLRSDGTRSPFLTAADINMLDEVGMIRAWPLWTAVGSGRNAQHIARDYPGIDLPCDGSSFDVATYPELYAVLGTNVTPVIDYHVIKAKSILEVIDSFNSSGGTLADAVATIHETEVYTSANDLPSTPAVGELAIVYREGVYFVYERTATGWEIKS